MRISDWSSDVCSSDLMDAHHRGRKLAVELGVERRAPSGRHPRRHAFDDRAKRGSVLARLVEKRRPARGGGRIRTEERVAIDLGIVKAGAINGIPAKFNQICADAYFGYDQARDAASCHPGRRFAGRSEEHTSELQSLMRISYAVFCLK